MANLRHIFNKKYNNNHSIKLQKINRNNKLHYGDWGIISCEEGVVTPNQIETVRCLLSKSIKHIGKMWTKILPDKLVTRRPKDSRMGSGKGKPHVWVFVVRPGDILFEATQIPLYSLIKTFKLLRHKLPIKTKLIYKNGIYSN
ncbi:Ribosomal protein L16p/L10e family protein (apicoplast) [Babesia bovis T2Bo]|uniref:Rpl16 n=1 Tax=Babesia bovis TaxID=5865 RepID=A7AXG8_BABBO|nr:Ribosomal protein L16p/L10e family protein [Babesia bovis T2Bo]EDO05091.1 Ribosomal protein L16p/L10e family protein [Babesia bovis T2Bo]|eukprot:YP_002290871.1 rpl16 (apicoplast) [Babesia bovis T2Bo]